MKTKYFVFASAVAILASVMLLKNCDNKNNVISKNKVPEAYIDPPFDVQVSRTIFDVDASEGAGCEIRTDRNQYTGISLFR